MKEKGMNGEEVSEPQRAEDARQCHCKLETHVNKVSAFSGHMLSVMSPNV